MLFKMKRTGVYFFKCSLLLIIACITLFACSKSIIKEHIPEDHLNYIHNSEREKVAKEVKSRIELVTFIVMDIIENNENIKHELLNILHQSRKNGKNEAVSFTNILNSDGGVSNQFSEKFVNEFTQRLESGKFAFSNKVVEELQKVRQFGKKAIVVNQNEQLNNSSNWDLNYVTMAHIGSYIYFPYSENFEHFSYPTFYYTYDPLNPNALNTEIFWENNNQFFSNWVSGNEEWAMANPTLVLLLDDDIAGNHLEHYLTSRCAQGNFLAYLCMTELFNSPPTTQSTPPPTPPSATYNGPLQNNIAPFAHASITNDKYILSATIPKVRIKRNVRYGFWSGPNVLYMYRANAKIFSPEVNSFFDAIKDTSFTVIDKLFISRKSGRNGNWINVNATYTSKWGQEQKDNYIALTYRAHWLQVSPLAINFKASAGVSWDTTRIPITVNINDPITGLGAAVTTYRQRGWVPSFNASANVEGSITIKRNQRLMIGGHITRSSFMANAIGNNFGLGICNNTGLSLCERDWAIRSIGTNFEFFWRVNITY